MLHKETVTTTTLELLKELMLDEKLNGFFLAGGTALSLLIGHRISIDIDLFSQFPFDENALSTHLESYERFQLNYIHSNTIKGQMKDVQVDIITHAYPLIKNVLKIEDVRLADIEDIAAMKLNAIIGNGTRIKDFIDIAFISSFLSLQQMTDAYETKYASRNPVMVLKSLMYHQEINFNEPIRMIHGAFKWEPIKLRLDEMVKFPHKVFSAPPIH